MKILLCMMALLSGCHPSYIRCRSEYLYPTYLASERINTPDCNRQCFYGEQIIVSWNLPPSCCDRPIDIQLEVRYGNRELESFSKRVSKPKGWALFPIINQNYWSREGILAYRARLFREGEIVDEWSHSLWVDIIDIEPKQSNRPAD